MDKINIELENVIFFAGAGISNASGVPDAKKIKRKILKSFSSTLKINDLIINSKIPFELFIETISEKIRIDGLLKIFESNFPNHYHNLIAKFFVDRKIKTIVTTNFDILFEKAVENLDEKFIYNTYSKNYNSINWSEFNQKIIKLHGSIDSPKDLGFTLSKVSNKQNVETISKVIKEIFSPKNSNKIIIIGYSISDHFDINPALKLLKEKSTEIICIFHTDEKKIDIKPLHNNNIIKILKNSNGYLIYGETQFVLENILDLKLSKITLPKRKLKLWEKEIEKWINSENITISQKLHVIGRLLIKTNHYFQAKEILIKAYNSINKKNYNEKAYNCLNIGICFYRTKMFKEAIKWYNKCLYFATRCNDYGVIGQALGNIGNVYFSDNKLIKAKKFQEKCLEISNKHRFLRLKSTTFGNIGIIEEKFKNFDTAIALHRKALKISKKIGDSISIGRHFYNIASIYEELNNFRKSSIWINKSLKYSEITGQNELKVYCLYVKSKIEIKRNNFIFAKKYLLDGIELIKESNEILLLDKINILLEEVEKKI